MKLINPNVEQWHCGYTLPEIWSHIAKCARVCYQSEPRNNGETDEEFVKRVILRNHSFDEIGESRELQLKLHLSCLEHGTVYLEIPWEEDTLTTISFFENNIYSKHNCAANDHYHITTNMRVIIENNLMDVLHYITKPNVFHHLRTTFNIITDIGVARELARHRTHSISEESTRYCNYSKDKFGNEVTFIIPDWASVYYADGSVKLDAINTNLIYNATTNDTQPLYSNKVTKDFLLGLYKVENLYFLLLNNGYTPQQARQILPLSTKVQTIHTSFDTDWFEFIELRADRCSGSVHPNMKVIANKIKDLMIIANATN